MFFVPIPDLGLLKITVTPSFKITEAEILTDLTRVLPGAGESSSSSEITGIVNLVVRYIRGEASPEDVLPYLSLPRGTQGLILLATLAIPRGKVASYSQIAEILRTHPRVVGRALARNKIPVIIPCHRVVKSDCELGGYTAGIEVKRKLLELEGVIVREGNRISRKFLVDLEELKQRFLRLLEAARALHISEDFIR